MPYLPQSLKSWLGVTVKKQTCNGAAGLGEANGDGRISMRFGAATPPTARTSDRIQVHSKSAKSPSEKKIKSQREQQALFSPRSHRCSCKNAVAKTSFNLDSAFLRKRH